jgi:hypothetical protein
MLKVKTINKNKEEKEAIIKKEFIIKDNIKKALK